MDTAAPTADTLPDVKPDPTGVSRRVERDVAVHDGHPIHRIVLANHHGMTVSILTFGGIIESLSVPDRDGTIDDVVLGCPGVEDYFRDRHYFGALVGRYANRIAGAQFQLDGSTYHLEANDGTNHLHGGALGFHARAWTLVPPRANDSSSVCLTMRSPNGEGGYPGNLAVSVTYTLTATNALIVDYEATSDGATPFSPTQHSYFNLGGGSTTDILGHYLTIPASHFTPVTPALIPTGELRSVDGSAFDFRVAQPIGSRIESPDPQMHLGHGYDHNFALDTPRSDAPRLAARLYEPHTGRRLEVLTTAPGVQLCTGNALHQGVRGKHGIIYGHHAGVALETQHFPDAPNQSAFPSAILRPGERFVSRTVFQFSVEPRDALADTPSQRP